MTFRNAATSGGRPAMREVLLPIRRLNAPYRRALHAGGIAVAMIVAGYTSVRLGKDANWDLQNYHFDNAYALMEGRLGCDFAPAHIQSFHNPRPSTSMAAPSSPVARPARRRGDPADAG